MFRKYLFCIPLVFLLVVIVSNVMADGRINVVHHFGGDVLFCTQADGCKLLNMHGEELWHQPQSVIEAALARACETGETQTIEAGIGTYGPNTLLLSCFGGDIETAFLNMTGYDEWGKWNIIQFGPDYLPVNPPANGAAPDVEDNRCAYELGESEFSVDGSHMGGFDIWDSGIDGFLDEGDDFITWSKTDLGLPACQFKRG